MVTNLGMIGLFDSINQFGSILLNLMARECVQSNR